MLSSQLLKQRSNFTSAQFVCSIYQLNNGLVKKPKNVLRPSLILHKQHVYVTIYLTLYLLRGIVPGRCAKYCDECVCLSVCLSVRSYISETTLRRWTWLGLPLTALQYVMYSTSGFVDDVMFSVSHNGSLPKSLCSNWILLNYKELEMRSRALRVAVRHVVTPPSE